MIWPFSRREKAETSDKDVDVLRAEAAAAAPAGPFRMVVEDVFSITGRGTVVTGRVETGRLTAGQQVTLVRAGEGVATTEVTAIEKFRAKTDVAEPGENVGLLLRGIAKDEVQRGDVVEHAG